VGPPFTTLIFGHPPVGWLEELLFALEEDLAELLDLAELEDFALLLEDLSLLIVCEEELSPCTSLEVGTGILLLEEISGKVSAEDSGAGGSTVSEEVGMPAFSCSRVVMG
jgi:hypothetical protein